MTSFHFNAKNQLCTSQDKPLTDVIGTYEHPVYVYDLAHMLKRVEFWQKTFAGVDAHYAIKANAHLEILKAFRKAGMRVDVVSGGEIERCRQAGYDGREMIFSGVAKTASEIRLALDADLLQINVESPQELKRIGEIARSLKKKARVAFRMNPDVDARTHPYITTGFRENKFGMDESFLPELLSVLKQYPEIELKGLTLHIGSQLMDLEPLEQALHKTIHTWTQLKAQGFKLETFDFGGGVGIHYTSADETMELDFTTRYGALVDRLLKPLGCRLLCEPGRFLVGRGGALVAEVQYIKITQFKKFCIIDSGMNHLMRPTLYEAYHRIEPLNKKAGAERFNYDVVGPICESSDFFAKDRELDELVQGDHIAILDAGAYGAAMSNRYNLHADAEEIIVS